MKKQFLLGLSVLVFSFINTAAFSEEDRSKAADGAMVGASTQVMTTAALDYVTNPNGQPEDPNKTILKRAITGAVTGATAAGMTADSSTSASSESVAPKESTEENNFSKSSNAEHGKHHKKKFKDKKGHRPPGWDRGKKTGWRDSDEPPGYSKK